MAARRLVALDGAVFMGVLNPSWSTSGVVSRFSRLLASPDLMDTSRDFCLAEPELLGVTNICLDLELDTRPLLGVALDRGEGVAPGPSPLSVSL